MIVVDRSCSVPQNSQYLLEISMRSPHAVQNLIADNRDELPRGYLDASVALKRVVLLEVTVLGASLYVLSLVRPSQSESSYVVVVCG
jgi:hypothetical protein